MEVITMSRVTASLTFVILVVCCVDAGTISFPRMGRSNSLAFPRTGKSSSQGMQRDTRGNNLAFARMGRGNSLAFPRMGRSPGLYFPRMGRSNYLAFPRMGRSSDVTQPAAECCGIGFKTLVLLGQDDKPEEISSVCEASDCCEGLKESWEKTSVEGVVYSICQPDEDSESDQSPTAVYDKLKRLIPPM